MPVTRIFTFGPDWGLPTTGPFALKLLCWLNLNDIPYTQVVENNPGRGPAGKSPWAEIDGKPVADSERIIAQLAARYGIAYPVDPSTATDAAAHAFKIAFEEQFHQILEWELFVHPSGAEYIDGAVRREVPRIVASLVSASFRRHFRKQLVARGIGRHDPATIFDLGRRNVDALATWLRDRDFLGEGVPSIADLSVFGQLAPMLRWPMQTPVANYAKESDGIRAWADRMAAHCLK